MSRYLLVLSLAILAFSGLCPASTNAYFSSQVSVSGSTFSTGFWEASSSAAPDLEDFRTGLLSGAQTFYDQMSAEFKALFSAEDFAAVWEGGATITNIEFLAPVVQTLGGGWHEQPAKITFSDSTSANYNLIFHLEGGEWKLYATEEI